MESELFNPQIENYVISWEEREGSTKGVNALIQLNDFTKIGRIETEGIIYKKISMFDIDNSVVLIANKKIGWTTTRFELKDSDGIEIGRAIMKNNLFIRTNKSDFIMVNPKDEKILTVKYPSRLVGVNEINTFDGKNVAKFEVKYELIKTDFWRSYDTHTCYLQFSKPDFDRKILWGFLISYISSFFNDIYKPDGAG